MNTVILFSPSVNGFYDSRLLIEYRANNSLPDDVIEMTEKEMSVFYMSEPPTGKKLGSVNNRPTWIDLPKKTKEELISIAEQQRKNLLSNADAATADWRTELALGIIDDDDIAKLTEWMKYIKAVKAIDTSTAPNINWLEAPSI